MITNVFVKNRSFHCKARDQYYARAFEAFGEIRDWIGEHEAGEIGAVRTLLHRLEALVRHLDLSYQYALDAVRGLKRGKLKRYRHDTENGVLEEEIVLCYFLEEMISSTQFLKKRLKTDLKVRIYHERLRRMQAAEPPGREGFLAHILQNLDELPRTGRGEIEALFGLMEARYRIGNNLFEILRKMGR